MTLILSGTDGLSDVDGSAATPAIRGTDTNTGFYFPAADQIAASLGGSPAWSASSTFGFKNRIINGGMVIDQRNAGASVTQTTSDLFPVDRFRIVGSVTSKFTGQRSTVAPAGFINSLLLTSSAATSLAAGDYYVCTQKVEGLNIADLGWGTANAQTVTLSFWVRSSLTGTFGGAILNNAANRSYPFTYTINAANTYEYKTITIPGDTSGTWLTDNNTGMFVNFSLGSGSTYSGTAGAWAGAFYFSATGATSVVGTSGATFYITGVQLERGSTATSFDFRSYGTELALCQRYYEVYSTLSGGIASVGQALTTSSAIYAVPFKVTKRSAPSFSSSGTWIALTFNGGSAGGTIGLEVASIDGARLNMTSGSGLTAGNASSLFSNGVTSTLNFSSEL